MIDYSIQTCQHINSSLSVDFDFIAKTKYLQDKPLFLTLFIRKRPIYVKLELRLLTDLVCPLWYSLCDVGYESFYSLLVLFTILCIGIVGILYIS